MRGVSLARAFLIASCTVFLVSLSNAPALLAQQPRKDAEIAPTPGVTRIETPGELVTAPHRTPPPKRTLTPQRSQGSHTSSALTAGLGGPGAGGISPPSDPVRGRAAAIHGLRPAREAPDSRGAATWILFSVLMVLLGGVTIRMVRGFGERDLFERLERDDMETQIPG